MNHLRNGFLMLVAALAASGCYHAVVVTGQEPSSDYVENLWVTGFLHGLVVPGQIDVSRDCPHGVAIVETKVSRANQAVTTLTLGVYSPMDVKVTCAAAAAAEDGGDASEAVEK